MSVFWKKPKRLCKDSVGYILKVFGRCDGREKTSYSSRQYTSETNIKLSLIHEAGNFDNRRCYCAVYDAKSNFLYLLKYTSKGFKNEFTHIEMSEFPQYVTDYQAKYNGELINDEHT